MDAKMQRPRLATADVTGISFSQQLDDNNPTHKNASIIEPLLTKGDLEDILRIDKRTIDRMRSAGKLPKPDLFICRLPRWKSSTIQSWIDGGGK
jgi:predicted DNA-binding transcriptional regulator AlpA